MKPSRELNTKIATEVFGYKVWKHKGVMTENHPLGDRPLRNYSGEIEWAWEVANYMKITLIPTNDNQWFAFVGTPTGWESPQAAFQFLQEGNFNDAGAAVNESPALAICLAALKAVEKRSTTSESTKSAEVVNTESNVMH